MSAEQTTPTKLSSAEIKCILDTYDLTEEDREEYEYILDLLTALESKPGYVFKMSNPEDEDMAGSAYEQAIDAVGAYLKYGDEDAN